MRTYIETITEPEFERRMLAIGKEVKSLLSCRLKEDKHKYDKYIDLLQKYEAGCSMLEVK